MPSRPVVVLIVLFWLATLGFVAYRDVWPRLAASGPPPIAVDLADEASQFAAVRWQILRGREVIGRLNTRTTYVDADDSFRFTHQYSQVKLDVAGYRVVIPEATTVTRASRAGTLREQSMEGRLTLQARPTAADDFHTVAEARAKVEGRVENGRFVGHCEVTAPLFNVKQDLEPVPVTDGQAMSPLQPVNRVANVRPGQSWTVHAVDPLGEALALLLRKTLGGFGLPERKREPLIAKVGNEPQPLPWGKDRDEVPCWVIEYRSGDARAKTWVRVSDGRVLRQEAELLGERVALEREE